MRTERQEHDPVRRTGTRVNDWLPFWIALGAYLIFAGALLLAHERDWIPGGAVIVLHGIAGISFFMWTVMWSYTL